MSRRPTGSSMEDSCSIPTMSSVIAGLHSTRPNKVYNALVLVRTHFLKEKDGVAKLRQHGGLELIIDVLRQHENRILDVALSILGNCCLETETRVKVLRLHGIPMLADVLLKTKSQSIRNRACRTLANLSTDPQCCCAIHQVETLVATITTSLVTMSDDHECQQTYIRALRLFADTTGHHSAVLEASGLKCVCEVLKSTSKAVLTAALKTVAHLTEECTDECVRQLLLSDAPGLLVTLTSHPETTVNQLAWSRLLAYSKHEPLRLALGSAGVVSLLIGRVRLDCDRPASHRLAVVNALCHYCQEAVNRIRVRDSGGLELMLTLLGRTDYSLIHNRLISALVCFLYDETSIEMLLQNGLVGVLVGHLLRCAHIAESSADTGLGLSDDECADLIHPDPEDDPRQQDWLTSEKSDEQLTSRDDDVVESVSRCEINYGGDEEEAEDMLDYDNSESEVEAAFSDISSCTASVGGLDTAEGVRSGSSMDTNNQMVNAHCSDSSTNHAMPNQAMASTKDTDVAKRSQDGAVSESSDAGLSCAMSVASPVRSLGKEGSALDESEEETNTEPRYSIDSPTYKAVASWKTETPYSGPRNIMESIEYYGSASPGGLYGYYSPPRWSPYSPMSTTSYPSPVASPEASPRADSPSALVDMPYLSTYSTTFSGGTSPVHGATSQLDWSPDGGIAQQAATPTDLLEWSPVQQSSEHASGSDNVAESETACVSDSAATVALSRCHSSDDVFRLGQSCSAQPPNDDETRTGSDATDAGQCPDDSLLTCPHDRNNESRFGNSGDVPHTRPACTDDKPDSDGATLAVAGIRGAPVKPTGQRKRSLAPDTISKIRKIVDASAPNSLVDIGDLMTRGRGDPEPTPPDAYDRHRQPGKVTEHNILILLSRVSYMTDPSSYLLGGDALRGLLAYASMASLPLSRGARILQRVTRNPHCFEPIIRALIPSHIDRILGRKRPVERERCCRPTVSDVGNVAKQLFQAECSPEQRLGWEAGETLAYAGTDSSRKHVAMDADVSSQVPITEAVSECDTSEMNSKRVGIEIKCAQTSLRMEHTDTVTIGNRVTGGDTVTGGSGSDVSNDTTELKRCLLTNLSLLSESRYGRGVISHILLTGCPLDKLKIAISLPFLCRSRELRRKMLVEFRGLTLLLRSLEDPTTAVFPATVHSLSYLTVSLGLVFHHRHHQQTQPHQTSDDATSRSPADVTFVMDDGSHVPGRRERLALKSSVFAAMLEGHYSESGQSRVRIPHVRSRAFRVLVDCLQTDGDREEGANLAEVIAQVSGGEAAGGSDVNFMHTDADVGTDAVPDRVDSEKTPTSGDRRADMDTLLDVLVLSNQYLLPGLQHQVSLLLCCRYVARDSVERVLRLALLHNSAWLARQCVRYALAHAMSRSERVATMRSLLGPASMSDTITVVRDLLISAISG